MNKKQLPDRFVVDNATGDTFIEEADGRVFHLSGGTLQKAGWAADKGEMTHYYRTHGPKRGLRPEVLLGIISGTLLIPWLAFGLTIAGDQPTPPVWWAVIMTGIVSTAWISMGIMGYRYFRDNA